jgi:hypothetical protein
MFVSISPQKICLDVPALVKILVERGIGVGHRFNGDVAPERCQRNAIADFNPAMMRYQ